MLKYMNLKNGKCSLLIGGLLLLLLHGCGGSGSVRSQQDGPPAAPRDVSNVKNAVPQAEPRSQYGNPDSYEVFGQRYHVMDSSRGYLQRGIASWYGKKFHGRRTSSGESYDMYAMTAAHKSLPLPTYVQVTNLENDRSVIVKVNDRGPFHDNRIIDMSYAAAHKLGMVGKGTALVEVRTIQPGETQPAQPRFAARNSTRTTAMNDDQFFIQVGAFSSLDNAERLRTRLGKIEQKPAHIYQTVIDNETLYRVRIGPLNDVELADRIVADLPEHGVHEHQIVIE